MDKIICPLAIFTGHMIEKIEIYLINTILQNDHAVNPLVLTLPIYNLKHK